MGKALKTIARKTSRAAGDVVKPGVTADIYNVNSTAISKAAALGGGGNLDSAYSAISSVPGVNVPIGGMGWNQNVYVRGSQGFFTGYEYDGIPVNRAFDNYNSSTESSLGLQELQVYTGGGPAANSSSGTSGFINQVIKTGTYPGFASIDGGIGTDAYYHKLKIEAGGATPDRNFSYYVGLSGTNQAARLIDNNNGASYMGPGGIFATQYNSANQTGAMVNSEFEGALGTCQTNTLNAPLPTGGATTAVAPNCIDYYSGLVGNTSFVTDRENIINFHFGIPRKNGLRDDMQLLYSASSLKTWVYGSANDLGTNLDPTTGFTTGQDQVSLLTSGAVGNPGAAYANATVYNAPFGTPIAGLSTVNYLSPSSVQSGAFIPADHEDNIFNDTGITKIQYTHELSDHSYLRAFGYTFFSDWTQAGFLDAAGYNTGYATGVSPNYDLITHTNGAELQFADQLNAKNLVQLTGNYTSASVVRFNNTGFAAAGTSPIGVISQANGQYTCWDERTTLPGATKGSTIPNPAYDTQTPCYGSAYKSSAAAGIVSSKYNYAIGPNGQAAGASWDTLWDTEASGTYNTVKPRFSFVSLTDEFRPTDKLLISGGLRYENYTYGLANSSNSAANNFYAQIVSNYSCWAPGYGVASSPLPPGVPPPAPIQYVNGDCNAGLAAKGVSIPSGVTFVHPNGQAQDGVTAVPNFTASSPSSYPESFYSLRLSGTYTQSPDTVWRVSGGRFTEPPISASVQYLYSSGAANTLWSNFENLGFFSPFHNIPSQSASQYDVSLERHIRGTDVSFKLSPFYNFTNGYQADAFIGQGFVTQVPIGNFRSYGLEASLTKGDFNRDGLSGQVALTYANAKMQYKSEFGGQLPNGVAGINNAIDGFNALTKAGGGSPCYAAAKFDSSGNLAPGAGTNCSGATDILNPYYNSAAASHLDPNGWYPAATYALQPGVNTNPGYYDSPWVGSIVLNYRKAKFAITPSVQFTEGTSYGSPYDVQGYDPRLCAYNSSQPAAAADANGNPAHTAITTAGTNPQQCDYLALNGVTASPVGYLYIPNPQTNSFATLGAFREPNIITGNLQMSYDVSPRVSTTLTLANVFHRCFGGTKTPWSSAYAPGSAICGYGANSLYVGNYQNGAGQLTAGNPSTYDPAANGGVSVYPWQLQSYAPRTGSPAANGAAGAQLPLPFNAYFEVQIKL